MEEYMVLDENDEAIPEEERVDSDLPFNVNIEEIDLSVTDIVDIPLFTDEFVLPEHIPPLSINDVFTTNEISKQRQDIISQEVLFREPVIVPAPVTPIDDETNTIVLIFGFILLGLFTVMFMNLYLKKKKQVSENDFDF